MGWASRQLGTNQSQGMGQMEINKTKERILIWSCAIGGIIVFIFGAILLIGLYNEIRMFLIEEANRSAIQEMNESADSKVAAEPTIEDDVTEDGEACKTVMLFLNPGDTVTLHFPFQDDFAKTNMEAYTRPIQFSIPLDCYFPNTPLNDPIYTAVQKLSITYADGTEEDYELGPFDLPPFPSVSLTLVEPDSSEIKAGLMAQEDRTIYLEGWVDNHSVTVYVNGQMFDVYEGGIFLGYYELTQEEGEETIVIRAEKENMVTSTITITVVVNS
jgi:hypothetical protein